MRLVSLRNLAALLAVALLVALPLFASDFFVTFIMTRTVMLGLAASTIVFLSANVGMVSLAQMLMFGIAGFMIGNAVGEPGSKGLKLGWNPWVAVVFALAIVTAVACVLGALSARTAGIYFLMLTLTYAVIGYYFFGQVTTFSGFGGITGIRPPGVLAGHPVRLYYVGVVVSVLAYCGFRALARTPFGMALQGVRDDPIRMASLGFNVGLLRALAFTLAGFVAGVAGILNIWWNGQIDPASISIGPTLDLLIIAVIGGIAHLEGAWLGAFVFVIANNYMRDLPGASTLGLTEARFNTVVGLLVLLVMVLSPDGLVGVVMRLYGWIRRPAAAPEAPLPSGSGGHPFESADSGPPGRDLVPSQTTEGSLR